MTKTDHNFSHSCGSAIAKFETEIATKSGGESIITMGQLIQHQIELEFDTYKSYYNGNIEKLEEISKNENLAVLSKYFFSLSVFCQYCECLIGVAFLMTKYTQIKIRF